MVQNDGSSANSALTINATSAPSVFSGVIQDQDGTTGGTGTLALALSGNQSLTLIGASTYSGGTTVSGSSTLFANNTTGSATGTGTVTIGAGSTLAGSGIITGPVSFTGGTLAPSSGSTTAATLTLGSTTLDATSHSNFHLGAARHGRRWCERPGRGRRRPGLGRQPECQRSYWFWRRRLRALFLSGALSGNLSLGTLPSGFSYHIDLSSTPGEVLLDVTGGATLPGDVNHDGIVNGLDINAIATHWLAHGSGVLGDANGDGVVNGLDINLVATNWLHTAGGGAGLAVVGASASSTSVPEPSSMLLAILGLIGLGALRRRQAAK